jgi:hypothetical protein
MPPGVGGNRSSRGRPVRSEPGPGWPAGPVDTSPRPWASGPCRRWRWPRSCHRPSVPPVTAPPRSGRTARPRTSREDGAGRRGRGASAAPLVGAPAQADEDRVGAARAGDRARRGGSRTRQTLRAPSCSPRRREACPRVPGARVSFWRAPRPAPSGGGNQAPDPETGPGQSTLRSCRPGIGPGPARSTDRNRGRARSVAGACRANAAPS